MRKKLSWLPVIVLAIVFWHAGEGLQGDNGRPIPVPPKDRVNESSKPESAKEPKETVFQSGPVDRDAVVYVFQGSKLTTDR